MSLPEHVSTATDDPLLQCPPSPRSILRQPGSPSKFRPTLTPQESDSTFETEGMGRYSIDDTPETPRERTKIRIDESCNTIRYISEPSSPDVVSAAAPPASKNPAPRSPSRSPTKGPRSPSKPPSSSLAARPPFVVSKTMKPTNSSVPASVAKKVKAKMLPPIPKPPLPTPERGPSEEELKDLKEESGKLVEIQVRSEVAVAKGAAKSESELLEVTVETETEEPIETEHVNQKEPSESLSHEKETASNTDSEIENREPIESPVVAPQTIEAPVPQQPLTVVTLSSITRNIFGGHSPLSSSSTCKEAAQDAKETAGNKQPKKWPEVMPAPRLGTGNRFVQLPPSVRRF